MSTTTNTKPSIAIIGGGPAGLTIANLLHTSPLSPHLTFTVYESAPHPNASNARPSQGGTLDLHTETGLAALRKANLMTAFRKYARYDGDEMRIADKNNTVLVHKPASKPVARDETTDAADDRPEIDRGHLLKILREGLPEGVVKWNHRLLSCSQDGILQFSNPSSSSTDTPLESTTTTLGPFTLIIDASGAHSPVRRLLTDITPSYTGITGYEFTLPSPATRCPELHNMIGHGSYGTNSSGQLLNAQRVSSGDLKIRTWFRCAEHTAQTQLKELGPEGVRDELLQKYKAWAPEVLDFLRFADVESVRVWPCYGLPVGFQWEHREGVTMVGDAASLSPPFSGEGVNKAMRDGLELVRNLEEALLGGGSGDSVSSINGPEKKGIVSIDDAVLKYEEAMFPRALRIQRSLCRRSRGRSCCGVRGSGWQGTGA